jgi:hypothetical protein
MLLPYFKDSDTSLLNLISRFELKLNISDTAAMLLPYATKEYADTTGRLYAREDFLECFNVNFDLDTNGHFDSRRSYRCASVTVMDKSFCHRNTPYQHQQV